MIRSLHISNYALIASIDIDFTDGLNIITGETGAGKSIILGALNLLLGARSDAKVVTDPDKKSVVEVLFDTTGPDNTNAFFATTDIDPNDDGTIILRREIAPNGRSRAFINDTPVNLPQLKELGMMLVDIHSQHQNLLLGDGTFQMRIIDSIAGNHALLADYKKAFDHYRHTLKDYTDTRDLLRRSRDDSDFIRFQLNELDELHLSSDEEEDLEQQRTRLTESVAVKEAIAGALSPFAGESNVIDALDLSSDFIGDLADMMPELRPLVERMGNAIDELRDISNALEDCDRRYDIDPEKAAEIERRLNRIYSLETKHHVSTVAQLIELSGQLRSQLAMLDNADEVISALERKARAAKKEAVLIARRLTESRTAAAKSFASDLLVAARPLGMPNLRCDISVEPAKLNQYGADDIRFRFAFNKSQTPVDVSQEASGGEISRLMLAIKAIISRRMSLPTIIFDEIDTGVSGDVASRMGTLMQSLASVIQVITITHLPQVASKGKTHFKVFKRDSEQSTNTYVERLDENGRIAELAMMLSGRADNEAAVATARSLLQPEQTNSNPHVQNGKE